MQSASALEERERLDIHSNAISHVLAIDRALDVYDALQEGSTLRFERARYSEDFSGLLTDDPHRDLV